MELDANDMITALTNQRNGALNETAQVYAMLEATKREVTELKAKIAELLETPKNT